MHFLDSIVDIASVLPCVHVKYSSSYPLHPGSPSHLSGVCVPEIIYPSLCLLSTSIYRTFLYVPGLGSTDLCIPIDPDPLIS